MDSYSAEQHRDLTVRGIIKKKKKSKGTVGRELFYKDFIILVSTGLSALASRPYLCFSVNNPLSHHFHSLSMILLAQKTLKYFGHQELCQ